MSIMLDFFKTLFAPADEPAHDPNDVRTTALVAESSWLPGIGRMASFWSRKHYYACGLPGVEADRLALYSDWRMTGQDLRNAIVHAVVHEWSSNPSLRERATHNAYCGAAHRHDAPAAEARGNTVRSDDSNADGGGMELVLSLNGYTMSGIVNANGNGTHRPQAYDFAQDEQGRPDSHEIR